MGNSSDQCKCQHSSSSISDQKRGQTAFTIFLTKTIGEPKTGIVHSPYRGSYGNV
jgi:hypothetical protein